VRGRRGVNSGCPRQADGADLGGSAEAGPTGAVEAITLQPQPRRGLLGAQTRVGPPPPAPGLSVQLWEELEALEACSLAGCPLAAGRTWSWNPAPRPGYGGGEASADRARPAAFAEK
jgi:hypothetical protein